MDFNENINSWKFEAIAYMQKIKRVAEDRKKYDNEDGKMID